jgi:hypothetical protein
LSFEAENAAYRRGREFGHLFGPASAGCLYLLYRVEALAIERAAAVAKHEKLRR